MKLLKKVSLLLAAIMVAASTNATLVQAQTDSLQTGWIYQNDAWYYIQADGNQAESKWDQINGFWYFFHSDGVMAKNEWVLYNGQWYYFVESGEMYTGWIEWKGLWYYLGEGGAMVTDRWIPDQNLNWYLVGLDGVWVQDTLIQPR